MALCGWIKVVVFLFLFFRNPVAAEKDDEAAAIDLIRALDRFQSRGNRQKPSEELLKIETELDASQSECVSTAELSAPYANGTIAAMGSLIVVDITLNMEFLRKEFGAKCGNTVNTLQYHSHMYWPFEGKTILNNDEKLCDTIGPHYDPGYACGPTGHPNCSSYGIPGSTALIGTQYYDGTYSCNPHLYRQFPYTCHAGDTSGKFGLLEVADGSQKIVRFVRVLYDWHAANTCNAETLFKSVVVHCSQGLRLFCCPWKQVYSLRDGKIAFLKSVVEKMEWIRSKETLGAADKNIYTNIELDQLAAFIRAHINWSN